MPAPTCCWRCEHSWTPAGKCSRRAGRWPEARWRSPATLSASAPQSLSSIVNTCGEKQITPRGLYWMVHFWVFVCVFIAILSFKITFGNLIIISNVKHLAAIQKGQANEYLNMTDIKKKTHKPHQVNVIRGYSLPCVSISTRLINKSTLFVRFPVTEQLTNWDNSYESLELRSAH